MDKQEQQTKRLLDSDEAMQPIDGCGCGQSPTAMQRSGASHDGGSLVTPPVAEPAAVPAGDTSVGAVAPPVDGPSRRGTKLVITLQPQAGAGYRAALAVGADGCDPLLRSIEVVGLAAALDELPGLVAEAEARWGVQPRYPATAPAPSRRATPIPASTKQRQREDQSGDPTQASGQSAPPVAPATPPVAKPGARPGSPDQLSLFG